jgi:hypothetical protein
MRKRISKSLCILCVGVLWLSLFKVQADAASDPRFFGKYCGTHVERYTVAVKFLGFTLWESQRQATFSLNAQVDYRENSRGTGLVSGKGVSAGRVEGEERTIPFVFAGVVTERGQVEGSGTAPGYESVRGEASLSADGNVLTIRGMDRTIRLQKDLCDNRAPTASIISPTSGSSFPWGDPVFLRGSASDPEDGAIPAERLVWTSEGRRLGNGLNIPVSDLSPGSHPIRFEATDSGGRTDAATITITILNEAPNPPHIEKPRADATYCAARAIPFEGWCQDPEEGKLPGKALTWSSRINGGPPIALGKGDSFTKRLVAGTHTITLTASDGHLSSSTTRRIVVQPGGECGPTVQIIKPSDPYGIAIGSEDRIIFLAEVEGASIPDRDIIWKDISEFHPTGREVGRGRRVSIGPWATGATDTLHTVKVTAADTATGTKNSDEIRVWVIPGGLY